MFNTLYIIICEYLLNIEFKNEHINNDLPDNQITQMGDANLLIPTSDQVYNPNDTNRTDNSDGHQVTNINNINTNTDLSNTDPSIPIIYSYDELEDTNRVIPTPSNPIIIDTGSGQIISTDNINNNVLNNFNSIE
jgi:hypothetical protein